MLDMPRQMARLTLSSGNNTVATVGTGLIWVVRNILITNTSTATTVSVSLAGTPVLSGMSIAANSVVALDVTQVLTAGQVIAASAANSACNLAIAGIEVVV